MAEEVAFFPRPLANEQTPCGVVDLDVINGNAQTMIERCEQHNVRLRPNVKTHKCREIAVIETGGSKRCISVSTVKEAEYFAEGGFDDILLTTIFTSDKLPRLKKLAESLQVFGLLIDNSYCLDHLESCPLSETSKRWRVFIKVDCGAERSGVLWDSSSLEALAMKMKSLQWVKLAGLYVFEGDSYHKEGQEELQALGDSVINKLSLINNRLNSIGIEVPEIAIGSTPSCSFPSDKALSNLTEFHPGNYIFYDVQQTLLGCCKQENIGFKVMTRVKGHYPHRNQLIVDAGFLAMSHDGYMGRTDMGDSLCWVEGHPDLRLIKMNQEVGVLEGRDGAAIDYTLYPIGSTLFLLPYHSCASACQFRSYLIVRGDQVVDVWNSCCGW